MKKLFALLIALMMVFSLAACGGGNDTPDPSGSEDNTPSSSQQQEQPSSTPDNGNEETPIDADQWNNDDYTDYTAGVPEPEFSYTMIGIIMKALTINGEATVDELNEWKQTMLNNGFEEVRDDGTIWAVANDSYHVEMNGITNGIAYIYIHLK